MDAKLRPSIKMAECQPIVWPFFHGSKIEPQKPLVYDDGDLVPWASRCHSCEEPTDNESLVPCPSAEHEAESPQVCMFCFVDGAVEAFGSFQHNLKCDSIHKFTPNQLRIVAALRDHFKTYDNCFENGDLLNSSNPGSPSLCLTRTKLVDALVSMMALAGGEPPECGVEEYDEDARKIWADAAQLARIYQDEI